MQEPAKIEVKINQNSHTKSPQEVFNKYSINRLSKKFNFLLGVFVSEILAIIISPKINEFIKIKIVNKIRRKYLFKDNISNKIVLYA